MPFRVFYGWVIVAACFVTGASYGIFMSFGVFFKPLQEEFGWSRTLTSSVQSFHIMTFALSCILIGWLTDRYGPRLALTLAAFFLGIGLTLSSQIHSIPQLYLFYTIASLGSGSLFSLTGATIQRWFVKRKNLALGLASSGTGFGAFILAPLSSYLISAFGWRLTYVILGGSLWFILILAAAAMVFSPEKKGLRPYGMEEVDLPLAAEKVANNAITQVWTLKEAVKTRAFIGACFMFMLTNFGVYLVSVHLVPFATDLDVSPAIAAGLLSLSSVTNGVAKVLGGALGDRVGWKKVLFMVYALSGVMMLWLMGAESLWMLYVFAVLYGFAYGGNLPLIIGSLGSFFGTRSLAALIGIMAGVGAAFGTLGPIVGGFIFDKLESYSLAFLLAAIAWGLAALTLLISKSPVKQTSLPR